MTNFKDDYFIFLDIDGVMNDENCPADDFLPEAVWVLNYLYNKYNAKVILSSSWREYYTFDDIKELFQKNGLLIKVIDKTPVFVGSYEKREINEEGLTLEEICNMQVPEDAGRNKEIMHYIQVHGIQKYVILDDFDFSNTELKNHLVKTWYWGKKDTGLRIKHIDKIEKIFKI